MPQSANRKLLYERVNATKRALIQEWKQKENFRDRNNFKKQGLLPESIGLTSLLLLWVAFKEDENVFPTVAAPEEVTALDFSEIINASFRKVFGWTQSGFSAAPLLNKNSAALFDNERGYTETVTWCLSSSILALYAEDKYDLLLEQEVHDGVLELCKNGFKALIDSQRPDGTWGFTSDGKGGRSLYFTYIANASLADFFDYVMDEINIVENANGEKTASQPMKAVISALDEIMGGDAVKAAEQARVKLNEFLIGTCLPLLPKLARCELMNDDDLQALGAWRTAAYPDESAANKKFYHHLYYTYYILDMMITACADEYFNECVKDAAKREALLSVYKPHMEPYDADYYSSEAHFSEIFTNFYEQALHSSRMNYMSASRTGETFWEMSMSELPLRWDHEDANVQKMANTALDQSQATFSDPTILPMALRANTVYSYYVTKKPEITIERLFLDVCDNAYNDEIDEDDDEHVKDLWDGVYYNLMVTERSIESLVDFYDYLNMFEYQSVSVETKESAKVSEPTSRCETALSSVDAAVEAKIAEYLQSEKGSKIIENVIASKLASLQLPDPTHSASASVTQGVPGDEEIVKWIKGVEQQLSQNLNITEIRSGLLEEMLSLFDKLRDWSFRQTIDEQRPEGWKDIDVANISKDYEARRKALLRAVGNDVKNGGNDHKYDLEELYSAVKKLRD